MTKMWKPASARGALVLTLTAALVMMFAASSASALSMPQVSAGNVHTCGIKADGLAVCWGTEDGSGKVTPPADLGEVVQISAGGTHTCAVKANGVARCWGDNSEGQVQDTIYGVLRISAGDRHTCMVTVFKSVACIGSNSDGQRTVPQALVGRNDIVDVSAGRRHTCALNEGFAVICWGSDSDGQSNYPPLPMKSISAGGFHTCGVQTNGEAYCWGRPSYLLGAVEVGQVSSGTGHSCGITPAKTVTCKPTVPSSVVGFPSNVPPGVGFVSQISSGGSHTCAVRVVGTVVCWGDDSQGQLTPPPGAFPSLSGALVDFGDTGGLDFGDVRGGERSPVLTSVVQSQPLLSGVPLRLSNLALSNTGDGAFQVVSQSCAPSTLAAGAYCTIRVRFVPAPWHRGSISGAITITDDSEAGSRQIPLQGDALAPISPVIRKVFAMDNGPTTDFIWQLSEDAAVTITVAQPVTTTISKRVGRKTVKVKVTTIKQVQVAGNLNATAGNGMRTWDRKIGKAAAAKGTWAFVVTARTARGTVSGTGTLTVP